MKGKQATASANRRIHQLESRIRELENTVSELRETLKVTIAEKNTVIEQLRGQLASEVRNLSAATIANLENKHREEITATVTQHKNNATEALRMLQEHNAGRAPLELWGDICNLLGLNVGEVFSRIPGGVSRSAKRLSNSKVRGRIDRNKNSVTRSQGDATFNANWTIG